MARTFSHVDGQGRILIPTALRRAADLKSGMRVEIRLAEDGLAIRTIDALLAETVANLEMQDRKDGT